MMVTSTNDHVYYFYTIHIFVFALFEHESNTISIQSLCDLIKVVVKIDI